MNFTYKGDVMTEKAVLHITGVYPKPIPPEQFLIVCENILQQFKNNDLVVTPINCTVVVEWIN